MEHRELGRTGIEISRIVLGTAGFGGFGSSLDLVGRGETVEEAARIMDVAWENGIDTFDTADAYGGGASERAIGRWMQSRGVRPLLATKTFHPMSEGADRGLAPARIRRQVESSLERLGVETIDLYLTHEPDPATPLDETLDALDELVSEGRIRAYGGSHLTADLVRASSSRYGWVQNSFSLLDQADLDDLLPLVAQQRMGYTPYSPLSGGWLTGKYRRDTAPPSGSRMAVRPDPYVELDRPEVWAAVEAFRSHAAAVRVSMATLAYAWVLAVPQVTGILVGPRRPEQFRAVLDALAYEMSSEEHRLLAELFSGG